LGVPSHHIEITAPGPMERVRVSEIFASVQGEGATVGTPSAFVRLQGCSIGCTWCDTKYAWAPGGGREVTLDALLAQVRDIGLENVVVTGGEPLEHSGFPAVVKGLKAAGHRVEVETAGTLIPPDVPVDQWNVSLKLSHSGVPTERRLCARPIAAFRDLGGWFKFVVATERDVDEILAIQAAYRLASASVLLMPLGMRREEQEARMPLVIEWCRRYGFRFSPRIHILVWGPKRGV
jgi:7-carboxy-7-deazaguanine synthase